MATADRLQARLQALVARSPDIVVATDRKGTVVYYNDGASKSLGYRPDEIMGTSVVKLYSSADEAKRVMTAIRDEAHGGVDRAEAVQTRFVSKDGHEFPVAISGTIIRDDLGNEDGSIGYAKDLRDVLHESEMATLGEVAIGLSHEIRNPLAVVVNQIELLQNEVYDLAGERDCSVENERLDAMRREVGRISEIVERLSEMAAGDRYETIDYVGPAKMVNLSKRRGEGGRDERLQGLRVLVADDDGGICESMKEILEAAGCEVTTASDGEQALASVEAAATSEARFELVLSDVVMPKMDGYELYQALKKRQPGLPVLMMTAFHYDKDHIIKRSKIEGLEGVVFKKPVDPERLRDAIAEAVGRGLGSVFAAPWVLQLMPGSSPSETVLAARERIVRRHMEAENEHDFDAVIATFQHPRYELVATDRIHDGEAEVREYFRETRSAFPDQRNELIALRHAEDAVVVEFWLLGTHDGELMGIAATGRDFRVRMTAFFIFAGPESSGLVCERVYFDAATMLKQLTS